MWASLMSAGKTFIGWFSSGTRNCGVTPTNTDTEFTAEVVRITQVLPHPNADRLEIIRFEMKGIGETTYEVVSQKGQFSVGDLATYFSVDCLLPTSHPDFAFLLTRLDGAGKDYYRLKAARLRGVFSQGLLVPAPTGMDFGAAAAEHYGVSYYRRPEPGEPQEPGKPRKVKTQPMPIYGVDSLKKVPRLFEEGEWVMVTEKIHGTNFRFGWVRKKLFGIPFGWKFVVGSHRVIKEGDGNHFYGEDLWTQYAEKNNLAEKTKDYKGWAFYGELYGHTYSGQKIQDLTYGYRPEDGPQMMIFDIRSPNGKWTRYFEREVIAADCGFVTVPEVYSGPYPAEGVAAMAEGQSLIFHKQIREGVVVESQEGPRRKAKYVGQGYLLRKEAA